MRNHSNLYPLVSNDYSLSCCLGKWLLSTISRLFLSWFINGHNGLHRCHLLMNRESSMCRAINLFEPTLQCVSNLSHLDCAFEMSFSAFSAVRVNVTYGLHEERVMLSGMHTVADIFCCFCGQIVGWKYVCLCCNLLEFCGQLFSNLLIS